MSDLLSDEDRENYVVIRSEDCGPDRGAEGIEMADVTLGRDVVVLVDEDGTDIGQAPKLTAHQPPGLLHLAISVVLYRSDGLLVLQQRAASKYHFPLVWANACCSHPRPGESVFEAASSRVEEELGISCALEPAGNFRYRAVCPSTGLVEDEFDHVFVGWTDESPRPDSNEVVAVSYVSPRELLEGGSPGPLAPWLLDAVLLAETLRDGNARDVELGGNGGG